VARGTHALYLASGSYAAYPNESHPSFEGIPPPQVQPETHPAEQGLMIDGRCYL
jgi:hypothetical protein